MKGKPTREKKTSSRALIITGLSGSGKTVALRAVEDAGFFCVDNLPVSLISSLITKISSRAGTKNIAIGVDIREKEFLSGIDRVLKAIRSKYQVEILFLEADTDILIRRFKETRRPHPLGGEMGDAIAAEQKMLAPLKQNADRLIDTSSLSPHQLRKLVSSMYASVKERKDLAVSLISFGFKYGIPQNIDLLLDVRFLPNPYFIPLLKDLNGTNKQVADFIFQHAETKEFTRKIKDLLNFLIPLYIREGKSYLSIAFGCTGGMHRSPALIEEISRFIKKKNIALNVIHRDIS
ncbi:MAG: RNase adapter RapZ [Nitrospira bacterium HGW-Nitrospira-1]|nr:MAG: RNase adapter RapZ [Nitrospira bacterium HGW-Nitrospira-1]